MDMIGQKFGRLLVLHRDETKPSGHGKKIYWVCQCDCGNIKSVVAGNLRRGLTTSCGCYQKERAAQTRFRDLTGQRFGLLTAIRPTSQHADGTYYWECRCQCGTIKEIKGSYLTRGDTKSCGCVNRSIGEIIIENILCSIGVPFSRQQTFTECCSNKKYALYFDFAIFLNGKIHCLIEYQGEQHYKKAEGFSETLSERQERDLIKKEYCQKNGILLVEIPYTDINKIDIDYIKEKCNLCMDTSTM